MLKRMAAWVPLSRTPAGVVNATAPAGGGGVCTPKINCDTHEPKLTAMSNPSLPDPPATPTQASAVPVPSSSIDPTTGQCDECGHINMHHPSCSLHTTPAPTTGLPPPPQPHQPNKLKVAEIMHKRYCMETGARLQFHGWSRTWVALLVYGETSPLGFWDDQHLLQVASYVRRKWPEHWRDALAKAIKEPPRFEELLGYRNAEKRNRIKPQSDRDSVLRATGRVDTGAKGKEAARAIGEVAKEVIDNNKLAAQRWAQKARKAIE